MSDQQQSETCSQHIDSLCKEFNAVADEYHLLERSLQHPSIDAIGTLFPNAYSALSKTPEQIFTAEEVFKAARPALEYAKSLLEVFNARIQALQDSFDDFLKVGIYGYGDSVPQLFDPANRERLVRFFGSVGFTGACLEETNARLDGVRWLLLRATSDKMGTAEWIKEFH
jgi:hypothetical protein